MDAGAAVAQLQAGLQGVRYLDGGWQRIVDGLRQALATAGGTLHERVAVGAVRLLRCHGPHSHHPRHDRERRRGPGWAGAGGGDASFLGVAPGWLGDLGPPVEAVCLQLALQRPPATPVVLGVDQPLYLSPYAPLARLAPPGGAMVEVMQYRAPGRDTDAASDRAELDGLRRLAGLEDDEILDERFLRRMTVAHTLPLARRGGLAGRPGIHVPEASNMFLAGDWVGPAGMLGDAVGGQRAGGRSGRGRRGAPGRGTGGDWSVDARPAGAMSVSDVERFEHERPRLVGLAYRLLGSVADVEDVVQEAWLRWQQNDLDAIEQPAVWLTTVTSRIGLDRLRARQRDRADYAGPWLPEPIVVPMDTADPAHHAELSDSLTTAFLVMLEELSPTERLVLLLADVFDQPFAEISTISLGRSTDACRQVASWARRKVREAEAPRRGRGGAADAAAVGRSRRLCRCRPARPAGAP